MFSCLLIVDDEIFLRLLKQQITSLIIHREEKFTDQLTSIEIYSMMFSFILNFCERLTKFHFFPCNYRLQLCPVQFSSMNCKSAILNDLNITVNSFDECLYLFEGHFPSLSRLTIHVKEIGYATLNGENTVNII